MQCRESSTAPRRVGRALRRSRRLGLAARPDQVVRAVFAFDQTGIDRGRERRIVEGHGDVVPPGLARMRIWACTQDGVLTDSEAGKLLSGLPDSVFWGGMHQRDLLLALKKRWPSLQPDSTVTIGRRLLAGPPSEDHDASDIAQRRAIGGAGQSLGGSCANAARSRPPPAHAVPPNATPARRMRRRPRLQSGARNSF